MGRCIARLAEDEYVEWSTVVDAPVTYIIDRAEAVAEWGEERVARADAKGTSFIEGPYTLASLLVANRAGPRENQASLEAIRKQYRQPDG
jgi:hypothetical protein